MSSNILEKKSVKKVLFISNILSHITGFHLPCLKWFKGNGYEVHVMCNAMGEEKPDFCDKLFDLNISRSPFHLKNIKAIFNAKKIIDMEQYSIVHCHTPMGGVVGRLASVSIRKSNSKVIYTAHGFHFFKGSSLVDWILFYPIEKLLAKFTDKIITINEEDYKLAKKKFASKKTRIYKTNGVGVNINKFNVEKTDQKLQIRNRYGYKDSDLILFYAAEFINRKNHIFIVDNAKQWKSKLPNLKIIFAGKGKLLETMKHRSQENSTDDIIDFLGFRKDIPDLLKMADIILTPSRQEGLPINIVEGMASGLPIIGSRIRGHIDLIDEGINGFTFLFSKNNEIPSYIEHIIANYNDFSNNSIKKSLLYSQDVVIKQITDIYVETIKEIDCGQL